MNRKVNIMPMGGIGKRFIEFGISTPKPLVIINNLELFLHSALSMPAADLWIFIFREEHNINNNLTNLIKVNFKNYINISLHKDTEGQASTCLKTEKYLLEDDIITVGSCDTKYCIDEKQYFQIFEKYDATIFTTKNNKYSILNPDQFGWVSMNSGKIVKIKCKERISNDPKKDYTIIGSFGFKNKNVFLNSIKFILTNNIRVNNEFYMDTALEHLFNRNYKVYNQEISNFISHGTPHEIEENYK